ncbi:Cytosolic Fe-S cluster assembly factor NUBP2 homolog [Gryllus bimaculatus]|nr:Cytosolic Fe-S cluster assembly factor NUBP2 homolog [Gryllus bimaculatus]
MLDGVKHIIIVLSGKGGVGKSTVSTQLALCLREGGYKVGLLDVDLCGPSIPHLLNLEDQDVHQAPQGWIPVYADKEKQLAVMSIGFLLKSKNDSIVWRGPKKTAMIRQFLNDVYWEDLDYLIIDTPPGTSDEHITVMENLKSLSGDVNANCKNSAELSATSTIMEDIFFRHMRCDGAILVTTPQIVSVEDVKKELSFCERTKIPVLGECSNIFSVGGGRAMAEKAGIPLLAELPIDPRVWQSIEKRSSCVTLMPETTIAKKFSELALAVVNAVGENN